MDIYRDLILDHYKHPRNFGHVKHADTRAHGENVTCGDDVFIEIVFSMNRELLTIDQISFSGEGCAINQASASLLTDFVKHKPVVEVMKLSTKDVLALLGTTLTPSRIKCAILPLEVIQQAITDFQKK